MLSTLVMQITALRRILSSRSYGLVLDADILTGVVADHLCFLYVCISQFTTLAEWERSLRVLGLWGDFCVCHRLCYFRQQYMD